MTFEIEIRNEHLLALGAVIVIGGLVMALTGGGPAVTDRNEQYNYTVYETGEVAVNDSAVVQQSGYVRDPTTFQIIYGNRMTSLNIIGTYDGQTFYDAVYEEDGQTVMSLDRDIDPTDDVIDGYMVTYMRGDKENPTLVVDIYVDESFINATGTPQIVVWDQNIDTARAYDTNMTEISPGVFRDRIGEKSTRRFRPDIAASDANILVGDVDVIGEEPWTGDIWMGLE